MAKYKVDAYKCAYIDENAIPSNDHEVSAFLEEIVSDCSSKSLKAILASLPHSRATLIPIFASWKFVFHHVSDGKLCMFKNLNNANIPSFATHLVGGGALVLSKDFKRILLVKEATGVFKGYWKPPTGRIEKGETILHGIMRELKEETGVQATPLGLVSFRETFPSTWGLSDLFFVAIVIADSEEFVKDDREIADICWMPTHEFRKFKYKLPVFKVYNSILEEIERCSSIEDIKKMMNWQEINVSHGSRKATMYLGFSLSPKL